jgi:hypothetical protein
VEGLFWPLHGGGPLYKKLLPAPPLNAFDLVRRKSNLDFRKNQLFQQNDVQQEKAHDESN